MDNNMPKSAVIPLCALLTDIEIVDDLEKKQRDHFVIVSIDGEKIAKSEKMSGQPALRWHWSDQKFRFHPSSMIRIVIYRKSRALTTKHVGQCTGTVVELLDNTATIGLKDENGADIASKSKIKINISLDPQTKDAFEVFMKSVDDDISHMKSGVLASANDSSILDGLRTILKSTKSIIDTLGIANAHPILQVSWTVLSAVYTAVQQTKLLDDAVRDLADTLRETLGIAQQKDNLLFIKGTDNVIEEIGRTSLKVASLIHEYTRLPFIGRAAKFQMSDDMTSRIQQCQAICKDLQQKFDRRVIIETNRQVEIIKDVQLANKIYKQWLAAPDSSRNYNDARKKHQKGTCSGFLNGARFREFQEKADFLWIKGKAGSGKTILCSSIIDKIVKLRKENPSITYAYFFFDGRDSQNDLQKHDKLIRSLILQLSLQCDGIPAALVELYDLGYQQPSTKSLEDVLYVIIEGMSLTYIIIDSLDECTERQEMLEWVKEIVSHKISTLHMVVVSRPERDIEDALQLLDTRCIDLMNESKNDIIMYLNRQLSASQKWDEETRNIVKSTLAKRSEGMFRWVALQLIELQECPDQDSVLAQLDKLPSGLYETYDQILLKISKPGRNDTKTFLRWLCFSIRPVTLSEIAEAVMVDLDAENGPRYTPSRRYFDKKDILKKCSSLIVEFKGIIKLAHFSVKEYLLSDHLYTSPLVNFHLTTAELCHSLISQTCLAYLLQFNAPNSISWNTNISDSFPLARYAAEHWIFHAKAGGIDKSEQSQMLTLAASLFTQADAIFRNWARIWNLDDPYNQKHITTAGSPLYYASFAGLQQLCLYLLKEANVNVQGGDYGNALQAASYFGHEAIVKMLLEKGADTNAQGGKFHNALQAASCRGHQAIVQMLLANGADPNAQGTGYGVVLYDVAIMGYEAIVRILLENKADPNARRGKYGNALQAASYKGHEGVVKVLLEKGADPNAQGGEYGNALQAASCSGYGAIVKLLLEKGADPNMEGGEYPNALYAASYWGHDAVVKVLLEKGVDPNVQGREHRNALYAGSMEGHEEIVKMLLEKGADPNMQSGEYGNALYMASLKGHEAIVKVLLEKGADPNTQRGEDGSALYTASYTGYEEIVMLLLEKGADPNAQGGEFCSALQAASWKGHEAIVKMLVEKGANSNAGGGKHGKALYMASYWGHAAIAKVLLENGADPNAQGGEYCNALLAASMGGYKAIVKMLLEKGADPNMQSGEYGNALYMASLKGHEAIVKVLLQKGADPNAQRGEDGSALYAASYSGSWEIVILLLEKGADPNTQGGTYCNALQAASYMGYGGIVKMLLEKGVNPNTQGGEYSNALYAASLKGHKTIVKVLLQKGADLHAQGGEYGFALQAASRSGAKEVVMLLLEEGADPNMQGGKYCNALLAASEWGYEAIVKMLLEKGANPNAGGGRYGNALQTASFYDRQAVVKVLLENGADPNAQGGKSHNALLTASTRQHKAIVQMLLEKGADPNAQGGEYGSALQGASYRHDETIVKLLIDKGADPNAQGGTYGNALQAASYWGEKAIVKVLLENGADPNAQGGRYGNALQAAAASTWGYQAGIIELLLEKGAHNTTSV